VDAERWRRIRELVEQALERTGADRVRFLDDACANDASLRAEVESLLEEPETGFLRSPYAMKAEGGRYRSSQFVSETIRHYRVMEEISRGGMGVVYRALDTKLDREIALKFLPPELVRNPDRRRRFVTEAKAAASLGHPHIATIHDIDEWEGVTFIAMELIRGEKLSTVLGQGRLPLERALDLMTEVAEGLAFAHRAGIVHRDLKPANLMVTDSGHVKIIDFGLAKLIEPVTDESNERTRPHTDTAPGLLMGTLSYMSPEQARGQVVDQRSDVFTFGVVLYETVTGDLPLKAPSTAEIPHAIINEPAARIDLDDPGTALQEVLDRCLAKNPEERYRDTDELVTDLRGVREGLRGPVPHRRAKWRLAAATAAIGVAGIAGWTAWDGDEDAPTWHAVEFRNPIQVTSALGAEDFPSWSHDGVTLAFESNRRGNWDIWVTRVGGEPVNRTADNTGEDRFPSWSPNGSDIAFWSDRDGEGYYVMSALAGPARKVVSSDGTGPIHWSKDGGELTYVLASSDGVFFETVSLEGGGKRRIPAPGENVHRMFPSWSPDESLVAYMDASAFNSALHPLLLLRVGDGALFRITDGTTRVWNASWSADGRSLFFVSSRGGLGDLWQQWLSPRGEPVAEPIRVTTGMGLRNAVVSPDGTKLVYSRGRRMVNLWKAPIRPDRPATWTDARPLTFDQAFLAYVGLASRNRELVVSSNRLGNQDVWLIAKDGGEMRPITADPSTDFGPTGSPDGSTIAFYSNRSGNRDLWVVPVEGGAARQVTHDPAQDWHPDWSPDGKWITFMSTRGGSTDVWVIGADGENARQLTSHPEAEQFPRFSPDGKSILYASQKAMWLVPADGGEPRRVSEYDRWGYPRWHPDGRRVYLSQIRRSTGTIWELDTSSREARAVTDLTGRPGNLHALCLATDGETLFFGWDEDMGDLWIVDLETEP
jgi:Tol biopolymer transport system component/predicted Ser/Thr protein kinase